MQQWPQISVTQFHLVGASVLIGTASNINGILLTGYKYDFLRSS